MVYTFHKWSDMLEHVQRMNNLHTEGNYLLTSYCHKAIKSLAWFQRSANFMVVITTLFAITVLHWVKCWVSFSVEIESNLPSMTGFTPNISLFRTLDSRRVWPVDRGCSLLHGTWSHFWIPRSPCLSIFTDFVHRFPAFRVLSLVSEILYHNYYILLYHMKR